MKMKMTRLIGAALLALLGVIDVEASENDGYDPLETFAPLTLPNPVNRYRSANGAPGPDYWQNQADYELHATLDAEHNQLSASEVITYTNHSPDALDSLWLQLDQNIYREDSRAARASSRPRPAFTSGYQLESVETVRAGQSKVADYLVSDTRLQIRLKKSLAPGGQIRLKILYHYDIPAKFGGRTAWAETAEGKIFDIAQWFPRMAVYDDLRGWDTQPYTGAEFYLDYGAVDYYVTVPWDMLVAGSGELQNPKEVLTKVQRKRLKRAQNSDAAVFIQKAEEVGSQSSRPTKQGTLTWHYRMENTRDVAFSASRAFIWDAARLRLRGNNRALAMSFYPAVSAGEEAWGRSTEYIKHAVEEFSRQWVDYPYAAAINVAGPVSGMEYPGIVFDGLKSKGKGLFWLTAHEIGHTWFPMMVGSNERRNAWMDEGLNTFIDIRESDAFDGGVYGPKRDSEYAPGGGNPVEDIQELMADKNAPVIMTEAGAISEKYRHQVSYFKTALGLVLLREQILGPKRFDYAFRKYIRDWSYRHPSPSDFFRTMESAAGEDLAWFWRGWFMRNWQLDLAVQTVKYIENDPAKGSEITIANLNKLVMPATLEIRFEDGSSRRIRLPVESWIQSGTKNVVLGSSQPILSVSIDPDAVIPDRDRTNNSWPVKMAEASVISGQ